jgi:glycoside/pentoside/hexuronide:cation symporter, GPH family
MMRALPLPALFAYGLFGLPLAMVALPVYVYLPQLYAERFGLSLSAIGGALLGARLFDAFLDPAIGAWIDRRRDGSGYGRFIVLALPPLVAGFVALFQPPPAAGANPVAWFVAALLVVYAGFSLASIAHQSWGAALTQAQSERSRLTAMREACGLVGVVIAAALPGWLGFDVLLWLFIAATAIAALVLLLVAKRPQTATASGSGWRSIAAPFRNHHFRWLFAVFGVNGIAAAIPATLFLFFAGDRLQLAQKAGLFLVLYFVAAAVTMPLWAALASRAGEARAWLAAMLLAIATFIWSGWLAPGSTLAFSAICVLSGCALGADLALPPALLAAVIARGGDSGRCEASYFGAWNWMSKMNLALAAGISLPLLQRLGYAPGEQNVAGIQALGIAYALVPSALKLLAAAMLWRAPLRDL